jgi:hypothetical protein
MVASRPPSFHPIRAAVSTTLMGSIHGLVFNGYSDERISVQNDPPGVRLIILVLVSKLRKGKRCFPALMPSMGLPLTSVESAETILDHRCSLRQRNTSPCNRKAPVMAAHLFTITDSMPNGKKIFVNLAN